MDRLPLLPVDFQHERIECRGIGRGGNPTPGTSFGEGVSIIEFAEDRLWSSDTRFKTGVGGADASTANLTSALGVKLDRSGRVSEEEMDCHRFELPGTFPRRAGQAAQSND